MSAFIDKFLRSDSLTNRDMTIHEVLSYEIEQLLNHMRIQTNSSVNESIASSVLCYGIPSYIGMQISDIDLNKISNEIRAALRRFEPRLVGSTISVKSVRGEEDLAGACQIEVQGHLNAFADSSKYSPDFDFNKSFFCQYRLDIHFGGAKAIFSQFGHQSRH